VQAIARHTAAQKPADFIRCFTARIQALAADQDPLDRDEWRGGDVQDLVRAQLADLIGSRVTVNGQKQHLNAAAQAGVDQGRLRPLW
jgi:two-component sensor histidine kinase